MSTWKENYLQNANSSIMEFMIFFHDLTMNIVTFIISLISIMYLFLFNNKYKNRSFSKNHPLEIIWTMIPMMILTLIAIPSLKILYLTEEWNYPLMSIKSTSFQWYWKFELSNFKNLNFDSFMIKKNYLNNFRILDVDNHLILPFNTKINLLITSNDVIHSFSLPSLGIKIDAIPGRLNQTYILSKRPGIFFGQCSEICGMNHSFMPIVIELTNMNNFINYIKMNF
uniref:Cytochrome c oxidase subunit 2 n=1 Tax=Helorus sp. ZJUH_2016017 TaxID=2491159 RepID=A0A3Q8UA55_9HYME|nr:cytochrome c oxidase subunit 2 [Helorus sp. ZJUH_2016017]